MENVILFSGKHGDWSFARQIRTPSDDVPAFLSTVASVVNQRGDFYVAGAFDVSELLEALDDVAKTRNDLDKAISSAVRSRAVRSAVSSIVSTAASEYNLDKKPTAAFKDILKVFSVRYVLAQNVGDFEHVLDVGEKISPLGEGYFFVANTGGWVVVKKQKISEKTTPVDLLFYIASLSNSLQLKIPEFVDLPAVSGKIRPSEAYELALKASDGGREEHIFDLALKRYFAQTGFPIHYGVAYDRIRPPKRIKGVKTK